jgi:hypothetical protein
MLADLAHDVKLGIRGLLRDRGFALAALLSIGLGVGANSAIFSLVDQALFRLLPVRDPERLVLLNWNGTFVGGCVRDGRIGPILSRALPSRRLPFKHKSKRSVRELPVDGARFDFYRNRRAAISRCRSPG